MQKSIPALAFLALASLTLETNAQRAYAASNFALELDGSHVGFLKSVAGGAITAEVQDVAQGGQQSDKQLGRSIYEPFQIQFGIGASDPDLSNWIASVWNKNSQPMNGAIVISDHQMQTKFRREFFNAVITETTVPACDGSSREPGNLTVKFKPEYTQQVKGSGNSPSNVGVTQERAWLSANFRLTLDGLDCTHIARIESFTVKHVLPEAKAGETRDYYREPGKMDFPNLKITLSSASSQTWQDWFESFVIQGKHGPQEERKGRLEFLSPNRREVLATIEFTGLGIFRLETSGSQPNSDMVLRTTADLYCEGMKFIPGDAVSK